ncbi:hypothetical protein KY348_02280 [Candidatus Woesearchaeota archaeon]|nr:hypothetical protein [Candidatus Woesearchaeota archaeon]
MHPEFEKIVKEVYKLRKKYRPSTIISLFTSASRADKVSFDLIDKVFLKLDAGDEKTFQQVSRPKRQVTLAKIAEGIAKSKVKKKIIQTMLFTGKISTMKSKSITGYIKLLEKIKPEEVHLYTILYKPSTTKIKPVKMKQLERIAKWKRKQIGCEVKCYTDLTM